MGFFTKKTKYTFSSISPDEIFLDSENRADFDSAQFEGRMEKPIGSRAFLFLLFSFLFVGTFLFFRTGYLQVARGEDYRERAENNRLRLSSILPERGLIYDRKGELLAWNDTAFSLVLRKEIFEEENNGQSLSDFFEFLSKEGGEEANEPDKKEILEKTFSLAKKENKDLTVAVFKDWEDVNEIYQEWRHLPLSIEPLSLRAYKNAPGLSHVIGYIGYPSKDDIENFSSAAVYESMVGKAGVEKSYENILRGTPGFKITEVNSVNEIKSESIKNPSSSGSDIKLTIDARIQSKMYETLGSLVESRGFKGGAGVMVDVKNGEIIALASYPEYSSGVLSSGWPKETIKSYFIDEKKPFLNRAISGQYAPGSIIKPFVALAALNEKIISPEKKIFSSGSISIPNPYSPENPSIFYDWKAHGWVDMRRALAVSSNVYFYSIGGGFGDVVGLGIQKIGEYVKMFGLGQKTEIALEGESSGVVPSSESKNDSSGGEWRIGDTYNASIGQGNFQATPLQMALAVAALSNDGEMAKPKLLIDDKNAEIKKIDISKNSFRIVKEGMRECALSGTAQALGSLSVEMAAKTGTAELGSGKFVNSWSMSFWPYQNPKYAMVIVLEKGSASNLVGGVFAARQIVEWMETNAEEYVLE
ncbi:MAG: penicillin-binding protein 2 [Candidatus Pacebacteria bacterium]|nr:penicillin-binding protein 2 [Candidatus Paceibacterota bacterium]